ncbi:MAG: energy-coupling factor transport system substrate-specific component [Solirubrobacteraceae bacterium]|nr:energy-coupling factor transport system substrate-specific component [Solirubrobacteraceae bacterium]
MTWQLASFAVLALALAAGFAWYERARPSAKLLALVATLAALAALGRVAFAPIPSVKPTTDIVLLAGYALGGAPGFVVGSIAALASNVFFGQGPFTPWQMAGWGAVGVFGAVLARLFGRELGRWTLAGACALAGLLYGSFLDLHLWVMYSAHSWDEYLLVAGRGVPFNVAAAAGNVVFCLAFGPLLVRALDRYRERLDVTWHPLPAGPGGAGTAATLALVLALATAGAAATTEDAVAAAGAQSRAASFLTRAQNSDGGFGADRGRGSDPLYTSWAVIGLAAAGRDPQRVRRGGRSGVDYLVRNINRFKGIGDVERAILALRAAHRSVRSVGGRDLVAELIRKRRRNGSFAGLVNQTAFAILALRAAGRSPSDRTVRVAAGWLARQHNSDGGFNFAGKGGPSGIDDTAAAVQGLVAAGKRGTRTVSRGASFLAARQNADGGMPLSPGGASNAQSTAWAVQALVAAGRNPDRVRRRGARAPLAYIRSLQTASGAVRYSRTSTQTPVWVTAQALTGLARRPFPIR